MRLACAALERVGVRVMQCFLCPFVARVGAVGAPWSHGRCLPAAYPTCRHHQFTRPVACCHSIHTTLTVACAQHVVPAAGPQAVVGARFSGRVSAAGCIPEPKVRLAGLHVVSHAITGLWRAVGAARVCGGRATVTQPRVVSSEHFSSQKNQSKKGDEGGRGNSDTSGRQPTC